MIDTQNVGRIFKETNRQGQCSTMGCTTDTRTPLLSLCNTSPLNATLGWLWWPSVINIHKLIIILLLRYCNVLLNKY